MKAKVFIDEGAMLSPDQKMILDNKYDSYITFAVPSLVNFEDLVTLDQNLDFTETVDYVFACSNVKFLNFFMLRLTKEAGRQIANSRFVNVKSTIGVFAFVYDDANDRWILVN
ncbi:hypothetical protein G7L40_20110 [Paenibacillus polymyxa]|uniref:Uncharacterized protein n=1 Tax=Paenibacillus polymyxa TaxID=1406 RepID=A0A378Y0D5_PAEPO|nr:hypothetical protein [Paenibacillus polymyxa]MBE7896206.1 hypothetical protein [Paenibacillus polymyxa]MBG9765856.1 hypothetical protein [Paenibacillus polymyxa]MCC3256736.1 hypothetical protein [Paenibacillus polymyxa]QPK54777.1 hypothetical protein G7035_20150 [Paenibacillus polymyxa]QPK59868.1 hypothetical protein G7L40_20110 [Paenibacillus polymyxa]